MIKLTFCCLWLLMTLNSCRHTPPLMSQPKIIKNAEAFTQEGVQAFTEANRGQAKQLFKRALSIYESIDHQQGIVESLINLVEVALFERNNLIAQDYLNNAKKLARSISLASYQPRIDLLYAQMALQQKDFTQAEQWLHSLLPEFKGTEVIVKSFDPVQLTAIANRTKLAFIQNQDKRLWTARYATMLRLSKHPQPDLTARLLRFQAKLLDNRQDYQQAELLLEQALIEYKKQLTRTGIAATLTELAELHQAHGYWQQARDYFERASKVLYGLNDPYKMIPVLESLITIENKLGHQKQSKVLGQWLKKIKTNI